ncbi:MAG: peptidoglycan DD-metalloendopeptidase family protein [Candidatus Zambryskibacteria bacterium]
MPISVSAGAVGDFFSSIFGVASEENLLTSKNIQNMALLVAVATPLGNNRTFDAPTVEGNALVSGAGPSGMNISPLANKPSSDQISIYVVREGDTLSQIAEMFDVTVNTIKWGNNLSSNTLKVGDTLIILPISGVKHTVIKGDTLASVSKKYKGDIDEIVAYNNLQKGDSLAVGSVIIIPDGEVVVPPSYYGGSGSSGVKEYAGYYMRPIVGGKKTQGIHGYNGVDLAAPIGTPLLASADGEVIIARAGGWNGGYGNYIVIRHSNGTQTLYAHASKINVSAGDSVKQGNVIGSVGTSGKSTGPHVHFEIRGAKNPF